MRLTHFPFSGLNLFSPPEFTSPLFLPFLLRALPSSPPLDSPHKRYAIGIEHAMALWRGSLCAGDIDFHPLILLYLLSCLESRNGMG